MKLIITTLIAGMLFVPSAAFAQNISSFDINQLLQEDLSTLVALNGEQAVRDYIIRILILLSGGNGGHVNPSVHDSTDTHGNSSNDDVEVVTLSADDVEDTSAELRGEVKEGDDLKVWFAISRTDKTPSCTSSSQKESVSGEYDDGDDFEEKIRNLRKRTTYYYRACAENDDDDEDSGSVKKFKTGEDSNSDDEEPDVDTEDADDVEDDSAELNGSVDMNDFKNGKVFFVWGEDEDQIEDVEDEDEYSDIKEDDEDLQKKQVDSDLDKDEDYSLDVKNLEEDTEHYFVMCVEYDDEDDDETIECGEVESFKTDD